MPRLARGQSVAPMLLLFDSRCPLRGRQHCEPAACASRTCGHGEPPNAAVHSRHVLWHPRQRALRAGAAPGQCLPGARPNAAVSTQARPQQSQRWLRAPGARRRRHRGPPARPRGAASGVARRARPRSRLALAAALRSRRGRLLRPRAGAWPHHCRATSPPAPGAEAPRHARPRRLKLLCATPLHPQPHSHRRAVCPRLRCCWPRALRVGVPLLLQWRSKLDPAGQREPLPPR
mmetsp:Transcript_11219/g.35067  ORF Transcript_11219/g.35067 Transcript_11219/m.35067 type:complete len:233 (+) Transcript_11219:737-1435(+)